MRDAETIVHANAHHMATVIENTKDAIARIKAAGNEVDRDQAALSSSFRDAPTARKPVIHELHR